VFQDVNKLLTLPLGDDFAALSPFSEDLLLPAGPYKTQVNVL